VDDPSGPESPAERDHRLLNGSSFGAAAAAYAEHRPGYAGAAVRWVLEPVSGRQPLRVLDLAAGTGKLTAALAGLGAEVTAVEPDPAMLAELRRQLPAVPARNGSAEEIPLPDGSVDAVLAGQAMHWFDMDRALPEIARVLVPGGVLAALWNVDDDRVGWVAALAEISKGRSNITLRRWRDGTGHARVQRLAAARAGLFGPPRTREFPHGQRRTADSLAATVATHSNFLTLPEPDRSRLLARVRDLLHAQPETAEDEFDLPMVTVALRATRT
jgi:SAM-dependent methyltransferase